jgi:hypothetical protein
VFVALLLVGAGSAYYHLGPNNARLVWDRLPIAIVFTSLLAWVIGDRIDERIGVASTLPLTVCGLLSVWYWQHTESIGRGDLRPYAVAQFYPPLGILLLLLLFPRRGPSQWLWLAALGSYAVAKWAELGDAAVYAATGWVSGHTLKHLAATVSAYCLYRVWLPSRSDHRT